MSNIAQLFKSLHGALDRSKLVKLNTLTRKKGFPSKKVLNEMAGYFGISTDHVYYNTEGFIDRFIYLNGPIYFCINTFDSNVLHTIYPRKHLQQTEKFFAERIEEKDYVSVFQMMDKKLIIPLYIEMYDEIPDAQKYEIFVDLYIRSEYGFEMLSDEFLQKVFEHRFTSKPWKKRMKKLKEKVDGGGKSFTIYHGDNPKANPNDSYSWTLKKDIAKWFANRFGANGWVFQKEIKIDQVIDFFHQRSEAEVIVKTEFLK